MRRLGWLLRKLARLPAMPLRATLWWRRLQRLAVRQRTFRLPHARLLPEIERRSRTQTFSPPRMPPLRMPLMQNLRMQRLRMQRLRMQPRHQRRSTS